MLLFRFNSPLPCVLSPFVILRHPEIPWSTAVNATFCTRLDFPDFFFLLGSLHSFCNLSYQPFYPVFDPFSTSAVSTRHCSFARSLLSVYDDSYLCESLSRACDRFDDCFLFIWSTCTCSCRAAGSLSLETLFRWWLLLRLCLSAFAA